MALFLGMQDYINVFCYWVDVRKAVDSASHSWLIKMLEVHRLPSELVKLFKCIMENWSVRIWIPVRDGYEDVDKFI